jgi:hypothetical protein
VNVALPTGAGGLTRRVNLLAAERVALFAKAAKLTGLTKLEHARLKEIERDLEDCYVLRRQQRAVRDARRIT